MKWECMQKLIFTWYTCSKLYWRNFKPILNKKYCFYKLYYMSFESHINNKCATYTYSYFYTYVTRCWDLSSMIVLLFSFSSLGRHTYIRDKYNDAF